MTICKLCSKRACYGDPKTREAEYCKAHMQTGYVDVVHPKCKHEECQTRPTFGKIGTKIAEYCVLHIPVTEVDNYVNVLNKTCIHPECITRPTFGNIGTKLAEYCEAHIPKDKVDDYVNVVDKKCIHPECITRPTFGKIGTKIAEYCVLHIPVTEVDNYVNVLNKTCIHPECITRPTFGKIGTKLAEYCTDHIPKDKVDDYVDVRSKICIHPECQIQPSFGKTGTKLAEYCKTHIPKDEVKNYVNVVSKTCIHPECITRPTFGKPNTKLMEYCAEHAKLHPGYVNVKNKQCEHSNCTKLVAFGKLFQSKTHCHTHRTQNMYKKNHPKCEHEKCKQRPLYTDDNTNYPQRCEHHKTDNDVNIIESTCTSCNDLHYIKTGNVCSGCQTMVIELHVKESRIRTVLTANNIKFQHDQIVDKMCSKRRPDFVIDCDKYMLVVEVDENQHASYACECEQGRMIQIHNDIGMKTCFIRYNPDTYTDHQNKQHKTSTQNHKRETRLLDCIRAIQQHEPKHLLSVIYMYYDGDDTTNKILPINY